MREFRGYDFVNNGVFRDDNDIHSATKQKATTIDSVFITFHLNDKSKAICGHPFIKNFTLTAEDAGAQTYPAGGIVMNTWNDPVQYQMLLDALHFSNNTMVGLPPYFIKSFKAETIITAPVANGIAPTATDIPTKI
jgi:hypothetical protein